MLEEKTKETKEIRELVAILRDLDPFSLMLVKNSADTLHARDMMTRQHKGELAH